MSLSNGRTSRACARGDVDPPGDALGASASAANALDLKRLDVTDARGTTHTISTTSKPDVATEPFFVSVRPRSKEVAALRRRGYSAARMRRRLRTISAAAVLASVVCAPPAARAGTATSALSWVRLPGAETCIPTPELGTRIEKHLGRPVLVSPSVADVSIEGRVEPVGAGASRRFRAVVGGTRRTGETIGSREITSGDADCRSLDEGLVLVVALMIDPDAATSAPEPARSDPAAAPVVTREIVHEREIVREVREVEAPSRPWLVDASASGLASIARLPGVAPAAAVALRAGPAKLLAFEVSLGVVPSAELAVNGGRAVDYTLLEGGIAYCPGVALARRFGIVGCAGVRVGDVRASGRGFDANAEVDRGLFDVAAGARLVVDVTGPLFVSIGGTLLVPVVRERTTVTSPTDGAVTLHDRSPAGAEAGAGLGLHFSP